MFLRRSASFCGVLDVLLHRHSAPQPLGFEAKLSHPRARWQGLLRTEHTFNEREHADHGGQAKQAPQHFVSSMTQYIQPPSMLRVALLGSLWPTQRALSHICTLLSGCSPQTERVHGPSSRYLGSPQTVAHPYRRPTATHRNSMTYSGS